MTPLDTLVYNLDDDSQDMNAFVKYVMMTKCEGEINLETLNTFIQTNILIEEMTLWTPTK